MAISLAVAQEASILLLLLSRLRQTIFALIVDLIIGITTTISMEMNFVIKCLRLDIETFSV
jgi:hypothetical protein